MSELPEHEDDGAEVCGDSGAKAESPSVSEDIPEDILEDIPIRTPEETSEALADLETRHADKLQELADQGDQLLRLQAEFDNFRRRSLKEKQESLKFGHEGLVQDLLAAVDDLDRALEHGAQDSGPEVKTILDGIELVHRGVLAALAKTGVSEIEALGKIFDPADHEAMGQRVDEEQPANTVLEVFQKGYRIHDRMLRPARVLISQEAPQAAANDAADDAANDVANDEAGTETRTKTDD
ncbi:MAG: nucleotide exchange factor GrpE [Myxococcota bacterium]